MDQISNFFTVLVSCRLLTQQTVLSEESVCIKLDYTGCLQFLSLNSVFSKEALKLQIVLCQT